MFYLLVYYNPFSLYIVPSLICTYTEEGEKTSQDKQRQINLKIGEKDVY